MDFHEYSLRLYEQRQERELQTHNQYETWFVVTSAWELQALNKAELKELVDDAVLGGLAYKIEPCPF
jgi:bacterioferritin (cytochrome b1)